MTGKIFSGAVISPFFFFSFQNYLDAWISPSCFKLDKLGSGNTKGNVGSHI